MDKILNVCSNTLLKLFNKPTNPNTSQNKNKDNVTDLDPEDIPIDVSYSRDEVLEMLKSLNIKWESDQWWPVSGGMSTTFMYLLRR